MDLEWGKGSRDTPSIEVVSHQLPIQWEFHDPKMEVLYHIRPYFVGIFPYTALTCPYIGLIYGRYLQSIGS